jgi:pseudaminic acid biosynthesis-associated methylase
MTQLERWRGKFGDDYTSRNLPDDEVIAELAVCFATILQWTGPVESICEVGANVGRNLEAIQRLTKARLVGLEPNESARSQLVFDAVDGALGSRLPFGDGEFDLVFTVGVLIHIPTESIESAIDELVRVSGRWLLVAEYFAPEPQAISYRGLPDMLWKRDYGSLLLDRGLAPVAEGFWWRRTTPFDDCNWWLFRH